MKPQCKRFFAWMLPVAAALLVLIGTLTLGQTFTRYDELSLQRQDSQLEEMVRSADANIAL